MRRFLMLFFTLSLLVSPAHALPSQRYAALVVASSANETYTQQLLDGLYDRGLQATFLLQGDQLSSHPEIMERIHADGHQFGCRGFTGENMIFMSRREIAAEIIAFENLLPKNYPLRLFCPPGGCSDSIRQVAQARRLSIVSWSADADTPVSEIHDGSLILLQDYSLSSVEKALVLLDALLEEHFQLVTVSQLAKLRQIPLRPGKIYRSFPAPQSVDP